MAVPIKMPQLGMTMTEAKVVQWLKREGEPVRKGEPVASIETDKLNAEVEASADGVLRRIVAHEGAVVPVTGLMAVVAAPDEPESAVEAVAGGVSTVAPAPDALTTAATRRVAEQAPGGEAPALPAPHRERGAGGEGELRASPIARRLAAELGVDLSRVVGSGPGGRIVEADVRAAAGTAEQAPAAADGYVRASPLAKRLAREHGLDLHEVPGTGPEGRVIERDVLAFLERREAMAAPTPAAALTLHRRATIPFEGARRLIAERMHQSLQQAAQLTLTTEADATALVELRSHLVPAAQVYGHRPPSYTDLLVAIVARVLRDHPLLNSSLVVEQGRQEIACWQEINIGVAVALDPPERGLVVPVIRNADQKPLQAISEELGDLVARARAGRLTMDDLQGGTFTLTNLGQVEVDAFTPILNPPQAAILGIGRIARKPAVYQEQLAIRSLVTLSLTFDHRLVDGAPAGAFLRDVKHAIEAAAVGTPGREH
jgi:pyruvate dehydrogenase E2 component (dihydrolipoamide acetyltransferase)